MRLATAHIDGATQALRIDGPTATLLPFEDFGALVRSGPSWREDAASASGETLAVRELRLAQPVLAPEKIFCAGLNYRAHVLETGRPLPEYPTLFAKFARCLIGPTDELVLPAASSACDWEAELAVVIGAQARGLDERQAVAAIAGYTVANDVSMRDWQRRTTEMLQGKAFERSTPVGPHVVTGDECMDGAGLQITCSLDGEIMQQSTTSDMIFGPAALVSYISTFITLMPGDLILTGTPAGIGGARKPPVYLRSGQRMSTSIEGIGELVNTCVDG